MAALAPLGDGKNQIGDINQCINEILQKPRRDSEISKYQQQLAETSKLSQRDKTTTCADTALSQDKAAAGGGSDIKQPKN